MYVKRLTVLKFLSLVSKGCKSKLIHRKVYKRVARANAQYACSEETPTSHGGLKTKVKCCLLPEGYNAKYQLVCCKYNHQTTKCDAKNVGKLKKNHSLHCPCPCTTRYATMEKQIKSKNTGILL